MERVQKGGQIGRQKERGQKGGPTAVLTFDNEAQKGRLEEKQARRANFSTNFRKYAYFETRFCIESTKIKYVPLDAKCIG